MPHAMAGEETLDRDALHRLQRQKLATMLDRVLKSNAFYKAKLNAITFDAQTDPLDRLPFTTRTEIQADQTAHPPYGTNLTDPLDAYTRVHQTSASTGAPLRWLDTSESWSWWKRCWSIIYRAAGVDASDRLIFPFAFGPFIGFWAGFEGAAALGRLVLPAGGMTTSARIRYLLDHRATFICCTPTYALRMIECAAAEGIDLKNSPVRGLIVAGEPGGSIPSVRTRIESGFGARVFDHAGMTEMGAWGFECLEAPRGLHVMENEFIAEVIDPSGERTVAEGEVGELVLTNLGRVASPLIRYRTGDQVRLTASRCACGRSFSRIEGGILGRTDDMLLIRGNNVFPSAIEAIVREFDRIAEFRIEPVQSGAMLELHLQIELHPPDASTATDRAQIAATETQNATSDGTANTATTDTGALANNLATTVRDRLHFMPRVEVVPQGTLQRFEMKSQRVARPRTEPRL